MNRYQSRLALVPSAALVLLLAACGAGSSSASQPAASQAASQPAAASESAASSEAPAGGEMVMLVEFQFDPTELTVPAGTEVTFMNGDTAGHTVTEGTDGVAADDPMFDIELAANASESITFDEPGEVNVTCLIHSTMNMTITVE